MRRRLAEWAWRRLVAPQILAVLVDDKVTGDFGVFTVAEVRLVLGRRSRGRRG